MPHATADTELTSYLRTGESLLWTGRPDQGLRAYRADIYLIPFSLLWGGFAMFWNVAVWTMPGDDPFFRIWGMPFLLAGLYLMIGRFFHDAWWRARTRYGVTSRRILILRGKRLVALDLRALPYVGSDERPDGTGSILFAPPASLFNGSMRTSYSLWTPALVDDRFIGLDNVAQVYDIISNAMENAGRISDGSAPPPPPAPMAA